MTGKPLAVNREPQVLSSLFRVLPAAAKLPPTFPVAWAPLQSLEPFSSKLCDRSTAALSSRGLSHMAPVLPSVATLAPIVFPFRPKLLEAFGKRTLELLALPPPILKLIGQSYLP